MSGQVLRSPRPYGVYVHVPFCRMLCTYCDFVKYKGLEDWYDRYVEAVAAEADGWRGRLPPGPSSSLFFGGGTPSALGAERLALLCSELAERCPLDAGAEVCAELNPEDVDDSIAKALVASGFNRLSLGIQTFDDARLRRLGRLHSSKDAEVAARALLASGVPSVSADLMFGLPGQTLHDWQTDLECAIALRLPHLSCYALTLEPATPLARQVRRGRLRVAEDDDTAAMYDVACNRLRDAGYRHYEVSNWAQPGHESRHNLLYWRGQGYLGLGAGAVGCLDGRRWWNERAVERYWECVTTTCGAVVEEERLGTAERARELVVLALRTAEGLDLSRFQAEAGYTLQERLVPTMARLQEAGMLCLDQDWLQVPERHWGVLHSIVAEIIAAMPGHGVHSS